MGMHLCRILCWFTMHRAKRGAACQPGNGVLVLPLSCSGSRAAEKLFRGDGSDNASNHSGGGGGSTSDGLVDCCVNAFSPLLSSMGSYTANIVVLRMVCEVPFL